MRAGEPAIAVKLVVIETKLADELRMLGTPAFDSRAHVENDQTIVPVSEISEPVFNLKIVQITAANLFAFFGANHRGRRILSLPARDFLRIFHVRKIDYAQRPGGIVSQVNVMSVDECAVHAAGNGRGVFRN